MPVDGWILGEFLDTVFPEAVQSIGSRCWEGLLVSAQEDLER